MVEKKIGADLLTIPELELGYCARPGEVDVRVIGSPEVVAKARDIIEKKLAGAIFSQADESLAQVIVRELTCRKETLALAESCTGGLLAHKITNVAGASKVLHAAFVMYSNAEKERVLGVSPKLLRKEALTASILLNGRTIVSFATA